PPKSRGRADRDAQKKLKSLERKIAKLDEEKKALDANLLSVTDAAEAIMLQEQLVTLGGLVAGLEEEWLMLYNEAEG
ncbi:MAG: hypothetical protein KDA37_08170, partial [Planctomycetales bacterium]|nr:hypothetical protein [Planctomycetales bacterium]